MATLNKPVPRPRPRTAQGALAVRISPEMQLRRCLMACMLWEKNFYVSGEEIADVIADAVLGTAPQRAAELAIEAREKMKLRHAPLLVVREMARSDKHKHLVGDTLARIIQRPDELTEFLAIYWCLGKEPISAQVKKGLARAFTKFDEYQLAKYNREGAIRLKDVLFLCHAKPKDAEQEALWRSLIEGQLKVPDTWEVALSTGADKRDTWERLIRTNKLGAMALIRNLRNMQEVGVPRDTIRHGLSRANLRRVLPFRLITAAAAAPDFEPELEDCLKRYASEAPKLPGKTVFIVDVSGSMGVQVSYRSQISRLKVACSLAMLIRELCDGPYIYATAGNDYTRMHATMKVPPRRGFALSDAVIHTREEIGGGGIFLKQVMDFVREREHSADRVIVITDEQDCDDHDVRSPTKADTSWATHNYLINIATERNGIGYHKWVHIDGWSEAVLDYIREAERTASLPIQQQ